MKREMRVAEDPLRVLDQRLASGEIDQEEYEELRRVVLRGSSPGTGQGRFLSRSGLTILIVLGVVLAFAFTSMAVTYSTWAAPDGGSWPWSGCCSWGGMGGPMGEYDADVVIANYDYTPDEIRISVGTKVTWVNMDHVMHTVTFAEHGDDHGAGAIDSGPMYHMDTFSYTFEEPGTYEYHCDPHPYMTGVVIVEG